MEASWRSVPLSGAPCASAWFNTQHVEELGQHEAKPTEDWTAFCRDYADRNCTAIALRRLNRQP